MKNKTLPFNLQYFAESPSDGAGEGDINGDGGKGTKPGEESETDNDKPGTEPTFDELLKSGHQAEFDRRVQKAIETALTKQKGKYEALMNDKLSEAEKLAKMTKEEKQEYMQKKHERELEEREAAITRRELMAEAKNTLSEKGLPASLAEVLNYTDAESCKKSIESLEIAFSAAVEKAVEEKLKGGNPPRKAPEDVVTKEQFLKMGYAERLNLKTTNPDLYKQLSGK